MLPSVRVTRWQGTAQLTGFCPTAVPTARSARGEAGEDVAAAQAKSAIEALIKGENPKKPLSDQKLCTLLKSKGIALSRRTVMKYREQLGYDSSVKRKRY